MEKGLMEKINESAEMIKTAVPGFVPEAGIILGTGLGALAKEIRAVKVIPYSQIPYFPVSTVETHSGQLVLGELEGRKVIAMQVRGLYFSGGNLSRACYEGARGEIPDDIQRSGRAQPEI